MEFVRKEMAIGAHFSMEEFSRAFGRFRELYNIPPHRARCSPDVLLRFAVLYQRTPDTVLAFSTRFEYEGVPLLAAVVAPGTIALEGEVEENRMGDW
jgi:hypothetical protein